MCATSGGSLPATVVTKGVLPLLYVVAVETFRVIDGRAEHEEEPTHG